MEPSITVCSLRHNEMAELPPDYADLLGGGLSLRDHGVEEVALERGDALLAVRSLARAGIPILGGDFWWITASEGKVVGTWYAEQKPAETDAEFATRSCRMAEEYIYHVPEPVTGRAWFTIVVRQ